MALNIKVASYTDRGVRPGNEDAVLVHLDERFAVLAVADGMGGHAAGEVASGLAIDTLTSCSTGENDDAPKSIADLYALVNERIHATAEGNAEQAGMGTTLVSAFVVGDQYQVANVGDSRAYLIRADSVRQLTKDHSAVAEAVERGMMSKEQAAVSPLAHALTRSMGTCASVDADVFPGEGERWTAEDGDVLLLCSDGVCGVLEPEDMQRIILGTPDLDAAASDIVSLSFERGSTDNMSIVLCEFGELKRGEALPRRTSVSELRMLSEQETDPGTRPAVELTRDPVRDAAMEADRAAEPPRPSAVGRLLFIAAVAAALVAIIALACARRQADAASAASAPAVEPVTTSEPQASPPNR